MVTNPEKQNYTIEEWLAHEKATGIKHEYIDGEIYAMSGGTLRHARLIYRCMKAIDAHLDSEQCEVLPGELRVKINDTTYVYPRVCSFYPVSLVEGRCVNNIPL